MAKKKLNRIAIESIEINDVGVRRNRTAYLGKSGRVGSMNLARRTLCLLTLILCIFSVSAYNAKINGIYFNLNSSNLEASVTYYSSSSGSSNKYVGEITIPSEIEYNGSTYRVTSIGSSAFYGCSSLTSVVIPESVTSIGSSAFYGCSSLMSVVIPEGVSSIGSSVFSGCSSLTELTFNAENCTNCGSSISPVFPSTIASLIIGEKVTRIPSYAFSGCSSLTELTFNAENCTDCGSSSSPAFPSTITSLIIGEKVTRIPSYAFYGCTSLTSVVIPESVTSIGDYAFRNCSSLTELTFNAENCTNCGSSSSPAFPSTIASLIIGEKVTRIPSYAFYGCRSLTSVVIPESVTSIGNYAFSGCSSLTSVVITEGVTSIGNNAFSGCSSLTSVVIPEGVTSIGVSAFASCSSLTSVVIPEGVTLIGGSVFSGCSSLTSVVIPEGVTSIDRYAFSGCSSLTSVMIPEGVTSICEYAFNRCTSLTTVVIPESVTSIGNNAFEDCSSLTTVVIPEGVITVGDYVFSGCQSLTSIWLPASIKDLNPVSFNCENLMEVYVSEANPYYRSVNGLVFNKNLTTLVLVPGGITTLEELPETLKTIGKYACSRCRVLSSVKVPASVVEIEECAFDKCEMLTSVTLSSALKYIGEDAFYGCWKLANIELPKSLISLGIHAFDCCVDLESIEIPELVQEIGRGVFVGCEKLAKVKLPKSLAVLSQEAFLHCYALSEIINLNPYPQSIGWRCFEGVSSSTIVYVPKGSYIYYKLADGWKNFVIRELEEEEDTKNNDTIELAVISPDYGTVGYQYSLGYEAKFSVVPTSGWTIEAVIFNGETITPDENGFYSTGEMNKDCELEIVYSQIITGIEEIESDLNAVKVYCRNGEVRIDGLPGDEPVTVHSDKGILLFNGYADRIPVDKSNGVILVQIGTKVFKLAVR